MQSQLIEVSELAIEKLKDAIVLMDERGRSTNKGRSEILFKKEWDELRFLIFESKELLNDVVHPVLENDS